MKSKSTSAAEGELRSLKDRMRLIVSWPWRVIHLASHPRRSRELPCRLVPPLRCRVFGFLLKCSRPNGLNRCLDPSLSTSTKGVGTCVPCSGYPWLSSEAGQQVIGSRTRGYRCIAVHGFCRALRPSTLVDNTGVSGGVKDVKVFFAFPSVVFGLRRLPVIKKVHFMMQKPSTPTAVQTFEQAHFIG